MNEGNKVNERIGGRGYGYGWYGCGDEGRVMEEE